VTPPLVLVGHGSADPRFAATVEAIAAAVRAARPGLEVRIGYLEHGPPHVPTTAGPGTVSVPLLLSRGYHVRRDLPAQAPATVVADAVGPDPRLAAALADRLHEAGWNGEDVALAAAGSADPRSVDDVRAAAAMLAGALGVGVRAAFLSAAEPRLADLRPAAVASYLLAPGVFHDKASACGARVLAAPIGAHPAVAAVVLDRYDAAVAGQVPGRTAPA
jgi:sirohydrochlorin ferrochelatase